MEPHPPLRAPGQSTRNPPEKLLQSAGPGGVCCAGGFMSLGPPQTQEAHRADQGQGEENDQSAENLVQCRCSGGFCCAGGVVAAGGVIGARPRPSPSFFISCIRFHCSGGITFTLFGTNASFAIAPRTKIGSPGWMSAKVTLSRPRRNDVSSFSSMVCVTLSTRRIVSLGASTLFTSPTM